MKRTMAATALSFLLAVGGGVVFAETGSPGTSATPSAQASGQSGTSANAPAAVGFAEEEIQTGPWTVQRIDKQNRKLVLQAPDGTQNTVDVPTGTPGFDTLKKGDQVRFDYFDAAIVESPTNGAKKSTHNMASHDAAERANRTSTAGSGSNNSGSRQVKAIHKVGHTDSDAHSGTTGSNTSGNGMNGNAKENR